jgi:hypothetical protein
MICTPANRQLIGFPVLAIANPIFYEDWLLAAFGKVVSVILACL